MRPLSGGYQRWRRTLISFETPKPTSTHPAGQHAQPHPDTQTTKSTRTATKLDWIPSRPP